MTRHSIKVIVLFITILLLTGLNPAPRVFAQSTAQDVYFPDLTGSYPVGRVSYEWIDQSRDETFASAPGMKRDLMVYIWFPTQPNRRAPLLDYMDGAANWDIFMSKAFDANQGLDNKVHIHALRTTAINTDKPSYPVVIFVPGMGLTSLTYASILEDLASHGYIVIGTSHPFSTGYIGYPDGRTVELPSSGPSIQANQDLLNVWTKDVQFVLNQAQQLNTSDLNLKGHLDLSNVGIIGHGFGGATAAEVTAIDQRIKAGVDLDGPISVSGSYSTDTMNQPFLFVGTDAVPNTAQKVPGKFTLTIQGTAFMNFSDFALLKPLVPQHAMYTNILITLGAINAGHAVQVIDGNLLAFLDHTLKGADLKWPTFSEATVTAF